MLSTENGKDMALAARTPFCRHSIRLRRADAVKMAGYLPLGSTAKGASRVMDIAEALVGPTCQPSTVFRPPAVLCCWAVVEPEVPVSARPAR